MKTIRKSIFETNSSSTHSIAIPNIVKRDQTISPDENGEVHIIAQDFGRDYKVFTSAKDKASYLLSSLIGKGVGSTEQKRLRNALEKYLGAKVVLHPPEEYDCWGYVDHQSLHLPRGILDKGEELTLDFIFCSESTLTTSADG